MKENKITIITPPSAYERKSLRLMIFIGVLSVFFFLYSMLQKSNISYKPLYVLLMITMVYYACKYLHEWYHYFSISVKPKRVATKIYSVDILTTYCAGEPFDMLAETLTAIQQVTYPHTAWCCDEANDPQVKHLCHRLGVRHITRVVKKDAKAGNINNALQFATGEICLVLDPDHIPVPEILDEIVGYFEDADVGFVQVVQAYYNQTQSMVAKGAAQQTYQFYGPVMMTMNKYGTVQAIGANCTFRRAALDSIGGHASGLAEDMHTAMQMHARGWRSVYVPAILTRGLVPATMSSYYKQQLKWSRGTWELFVTTFPRLFTKFTWRQRFHYFTLPFHYLSGLIFVINFLIPVVSLFTGYIPLQMDVFNFMLAAFPLFCMGIFIRHYVQKWVAENTDRGFHIVGGILQIGTWWIHSVGLFYTIFRKKVPYIPTPKNDSGALPLLLSIPNILIAVISFSAIAYGFWHDNTPYTIFMSSLASLQILFMVFILSISGYISENSKVNRFATRLKEQNRWIILSHGFLRKYSVPLSIAVLLLFVVAFVEKQQLPDYLPKPLPDLQVFYRGLHFDDSTIINQSKNPSFLNIANKYDIAIAALNTTSNKEAVAVVDTALLRHLSAKSIIPLFCWKLGKQQNAPKASNQDNVVTQILSSDYDTQIASFAKQLASINQPVFLKCSIGSTGNYEYSSAPFVEKPEDFITAWRHVHRLFDTAGADKVIWVWDVDNPQTAADFFPGRQYVDWLNVNITARGTTQVENNGLRFFDSAYRPYHRLPLFTEAGLPVMVTATSGIITGTPTGWTAAFRTIDTAFTEVKAVIAGDGRPVSDAQLRLLFAAAAPSTRRLHAAETLLTKPVTTFKNYRLPEKLRSVVYNKGYYWFRNRHTLTLRTIETDVAAMKAMGINTVERIIPGIYDDVLEKVLLANKMNYVPRFWLLPAPASVGDDQLMKNQKEAILAQVKEKHATQNVVAWHLGDDLLYMLGNQTYRPNYFFYRQKYTAWLNDICAAIRQLDTTRPIIMDLHWDAEGLTRFNYYRNHVPQINYFMLEADTKYPEGLQLPLQKGMAWGKVPVELWRQLPSISQSGTIPAWQDLENTKFISMDGLLDLEGRKKETYATVAATWQNLQGVFPSFPSIKILRPALLTTPNERLRYQIVYKKDSANWVPFNQGDQHIQFEWWLVRVDQYNNTMFIKKAGEGASVSISIPMKPQYFRLYVEAIQGGFVKMISTSLNTPLE